MSGLTDTERMLIRAAVDADETGEGYNDTSNLFATVEMIVLARVCKALRGLADTGEAMVGDRADSGIAWQIARRTAEKVEQAAPEVHFVPGGMLGTMRYDKTRGCPCRTENGGSGVCGCTLGGPQVTC